MRPLTRLLGELDPPVRLGSGDDLPRQNIAKLLLPGYAVLLSTSPSGISTESIGEDKDKDVIGLIRPVKDLSIWLAEDQVELFSGIRHMMIHVVANGIVMPYLLDRNLETHLPVLPPEVDEVRFRWRSGKRKYRYNFYRLESHDQVELFL